MYNEIYIFFYFIFFLGGWAFKHIIYKAQRCVQDFFWGTFHVQRRGGRNIFIRGRSSLKCVKNIFAPAPLKYVLPPGITHMRMGQHTLSYTKKSLVFACATLPPSIRGRKILFWIWSRAYMSLMQHGSTRLHDKA